MNKKAQAQRLSELYAELAEKGTYFEVIRGCTAIDYTETRHSPDLESDLSQWRVADKSKKQIIVGVLSDYKYKWEDLCLNS